MKRILMLVIVLLAISVMTAGIVNARATQTTFTGTFTLTATSPGDIRVLKSGILLQIGAEASGPIISSDPRFTGTLQIVLSVIFNLNTGEGGSFGTFTVSNAGGTFEGRFENRDTGYVYWEGKLQGHGTGAYEGLLVKLDMGGLDWYRDADAATNGIEGTCTGHILSPHGA